MTSVQPKERKSLEDTVVSLRRELRSLYDSLKDKNDQLAVLEKDVRDRDISIRFLTSEFKKLKEINKPTASDLLTCKKIDKTCSDIVGDDLVMKLQNEIKERDFVIKELNHKIIRLSENMSSCQEESNSKDEILRDLQNELDKFRQVVRDCFYKFFLGNRKRFFYIQIKFRIQPACLSFSIDSNL